MESVMPKVVDFAEYKKTRETIALSRIREFIRLQEMPDQGDRIAAFALWSAKVMEEKQLFSGKQLPE